MIDPKLSDYIKEQSHEGVSNEEIRAELLRAGWESGAVDEAFGDISGGLAQIKKSKKKKIILAIVLGIVILVLPVIFLPDILGALSKDTVAAEDSDLRLETVNVPKSDNAYFDLAKLKDDIIYEPADKADIIAGIIAGKTWDDKLAEDIVLRNYKAFEYFSDAARKPKFQDPAYADPENITITTVVAPNMNWRRMSRLSAIKALYLAKNGKNQEAIEEALNAVRVGQKIQDSQAPTIEYLIAVAMKETGLETVQKVIASTELSGLELKQYAQSLDQFYKNEGGLISAFKGEYHIVSREIDLIAGGNKGAAALLEEEGSGKLNVADKVKNNFYFHPNETKSIFAGYTREGIKNADKFCGEIKTADFRRMAPSSAVELFVTENAIGKILHDVAAVSLTSMNRKKCEEDVLVASTQAIIAIKAFKNRTEKYPATLGELVPNYLPSIPLDYFSGFPIKYSAEKKIIYSIGGGMEDLGGSTGDDWRKMPNPTFKINF